jgi:alkyldihydroxyacetonephosphate synthase
MVSASLGFEPQEVEDPVPLERIRLRAPRIEPPAALAAICSTDVHARASHARGKSLADVAAALRGRFDHPPDVVARPSDEAGVEAVLEWAGAAGAKVVPYGGGTSVVGGVEPRFEEPSVSLDLVDLDRVLEVDEVSRAARIQAGARGPVLEEQLAERGMTMRFYPQSFEHSTLGGWIVTRAGGHFATLWTHVDDLVESVRAMTPTGLWESRRLPGSGAGPSPDRMLLGSEGILGVVTEAWVRVQPRPTQRLATTARFARFADGAEAVRAIVQARLHPSNCRLIDAEEARFTGAAGHTGPQGPGRGTAALLVLGFEGVDEEPALRAAMERAVALCREHGGEADATRSSYGGGAEGWKDTFLRAPHLRDALLRLGVVAETFETAITWERFPAFHESVSAAAREAAGPQALVTCRFTHAYQDGPAPYYTVLMPARRGEEAEQWWAVKRAASDAVIAGGGTITHHHAVGRDHRPWYDRQRPEPFAAALRAAKAAVDPQGILNPGVLLDP